MKFSAIKCATIVALTAFALTHPGAVAQQLNPQIKVSPGVQAVKPNDTTLPERVNALQAQVNQLVAQVKQQAAEIKSLQTNIASLATKHETDDAIGKINFKLNPILLWVNNYGNSAQNAGVWVEKNGTKPDKIANDLSVFIDKVYNNHKHNYGLTIVNPGAVVPINQIPAPTSTPQ